MRGLLRTLSGLILWAVAFCVLYAVQGLSCGLGWDQAPVLLGLSLSRWLLVGLYIAFVVAHLWLVRWLWPLAGAKGLIARLAPTLAVIGLISTVIIGLPATTLTICS